MLGAVLAVLLVTASLPFYLYAAYVIVLADPVTWADLRRHVLLISVGLVLNTVPVVGWMVPRLLAQLGGLSSVHAFLGLQAYAFLLFGLTGVYRLYRAKQAHDQYANPTPTVELADLDPQHVGAWRGRIRVGVVGWLVFWLLAYVTGFALFV